MAMFINTVFVCAESQYFKPFNIKPGMTVVEYNRFLRPIVSNFDELVFSEVNRVNDDVVPVVQEGKVLSLSWLESKHRTKVD